MDNPRSPAPPGGGQARGPGSIKVATFNCNRKTKTDPGAVADMLDRMGVDIAGIQDTGLTSAGDEVLAQQAFYRRGYRLICKSQVPRPGQAEYSNEELAELHRRFVKSRVDHNDRCRLAWAIRGRLFHRSQVVPSGLANTRFQVLRLVGRTQSLTFVNVYLPPSDKATPKGIEEIFENIEQVLGPGVRDPMILVGDMNGVEDPLLDRASHAPLTAAERATVECTTSLALFDPYRVVHPHESRFSFSGPVGQSRIDRTMVDTELWYGVMGAGVERLFDLDHNPAWVQLMVPADPRGVAAAPGAKAVRYDIP